MKVPPTITEFDKWAVQNGYRFMTRGSDGKYYHPATQSAWEGWIAALKWAGVSTEEFQNPGARDDL